MKLLYKLSLATAVILAVFWASLITVTNLCDERMLEHDGAVCNGLSSVQDILGYLPDAMYGGLFAISFLFIPIFFIWRTSVFAVWIKFAVWTIPAVLLVTFLASVSSWYGWSNINISEIVFTIPTYIAYFIASFVTIFRSWRDTSLDPNRVAVSGILVGVSLAGGGIILVMASIV